MLCCPWQLVFVDVLRWVSNYMAFSERNEIEVVVADEGNYLVIAVKD